MSNYQIAPDTWNSIFCQQTFTYYQNFKFVFLKTAFFMMRQYVKLVTICKLDTLHKIYIKKKKKVTVTPYFYPGHKSCHKKGNQNDNYLQGDSREDGKHYKQFVC